jgi:hypothetical protein
MALQTEFVPLELEGLHREAAIMKAEGWRFIQTHAVNGEEGVDLYYSFMKDGFVRNYRVAGVKKGQQVPSVTDLFLAAFVFENEARELFGVDMRDIALDFQGALYAPAEAEPMTFISPEQKAAREKAAKAAAAKADKAAAKDAGAQDGGKAASGRVFQMTPERRARLDAKMATMSPEKIAKVEAALKAIEERASQAQEAPASSPQPAEAGQEGAKAAEQTGGQPAEAADAPRDVELERKLAMMDPEKAARVRAVLGGGEAGSATEAQVQEQPVGSSAALDVQVEAKLSLMESGAADKVRAILLEKAAERAAAKGGK